MRIIAGIAKRRRILGPPGGTTRPMTDRMRESLFSSIADHIPGSTIVDLYAGSGSMGLEALSRGAGSVTFVERDRKAIHVLRANIETVDLGGTVIAGDVGRFLEQATDRFDVAFVDPPYALPLASLLTTLTQVSDVLADGGIAVVHRRRGSEAPQDIASLTLVDVRQYGGAELWRYEKEQK
jgi:16S rRNA (guanine966-N2)-methyltransferase